MADPDPKPAPDRAFEARVDDAPRLPPAHMRVEGRLADAAARLAPPAGAEALVVGAAAASPFLARLMISDGAWAADLFDRTPEATLDGLLADLRRAGAAEAEADFLSGLRIARRRAALFIALADLGGVWSLEDTTRALTIFADAALAAALERRLASEAASGRVEGFEAARPGFVALAMGKMGAYELNYSSDIDLIFLVAPWRFSPKAWIEAQDRLQRLAKGLVSALSERTADGYVARVDLRLRPDPGATPIAVSMETAERYYQTLGRTWERASHIKARPCAGDLEAGAVYLQRLSTFIWRRGLDFASMEDTSTILGQIRAQLQAQGRAGADGEPGFRGDDVKLGPGGIREIEFLAQSLQLAFGGRDRSLRAPETRRALVDLVAAGRLDEDKRQDLDAAYEHLRRLEHRIQMLEDQQTHRIPTADVDLTRVACLMGVSPETLEAQTSAHRAAVRRAAAPALDAPTSPKGEAAAPSAPTEALHAAAAAFPDPARAAAMAEAWFSGEKRALRSPRAQARLQRLAPDILRHLAAAPEPDAALVQFDRFLGGLPAGVQILSLFEAHPLALDLACEICATAPRLAGQLARRSSLLDAALDKGFFDPPPPRAALAAECAEALRVESDYERKLDAARRWAGDRRFQIGVGLIQGRFDLEAAETAFTDLADAAFDALWPLVLEHFADRHGRPPGRGAAVLAMGKLGSREMTATSDLDLIIIYDAALGESSTGRRPLPAPQYYARLTSALTMALSAPTAEGVVYEVDMRLRPSGRAGPLATSLAAFRRYQTEEAWTWEHMALTRARVVAGADDLAADVCAAVADALGQPHDVAKVAAAAADMRRRIDAAFPRTQGRVWALKHARGGIVDAEFVAQTALLAHGLGACGGAGVSLAARRLAQAGAMPADEAARLDAAHRLMATAQQIERVALDHPFDAEDAGAALADLMARACGAPDLATLETRLAAAQAEVRALFAHRIEACVATDPARNDAP